MIGAVIGTLFEPDSVCYHRLGLQVLSAEAISDAQDVYEYV